MSSLFEKSELSAALRHLLPAYHSRVFERIQSEPWIRRSNTKQKQGAPLNRTHPAKDHRR